MNAIADFTFANRTEAGHLLARELRHYAKDPRVIVLGLPRGGVPVAHEVAKELRAPLDVYVVRKLGVPGQEELAMGAIATGGVRILHDRVVQGLGIPASVIETVTAKEQQELLRREMAFRGERPPLALGGKTVILVDDGIATGSTMRAAIASVRRTGAGWIVAAAPTVARSTYEELEHLADEVVAVTAPSEFFGVGQWYEDFAQTTDEEVRACLGRGIVESRP